MQVFISDETGVEAIVFGDLNDDGILDVLLGSHSGMIRRMGTGGGNFGSGSTSGNDNDIIALQLTDMDADGDLDVIKVPAAGYVRWLENVGDGNMTFFHDMGVPYYTRRAAAFADFDGDGDLDMTLSKSGFAQEIYWYLNPGPEGDWLEASVTDKPEYTESLDGADFDADGDIDILSASWTDDRVSWSENTIGEGCTDPSACNYDPSASEENGSCCYDCGCTVQGAENYSAAACQDDGSCGFSIFGTVFFDENENGLMDSTEYGLPLQQVSLLPDSIVMTTNNDGRFFVSLSASDTYTFILAQNELFPYFTTLDSLTLDATVDNWNQPLFFGVSDEAPIYEMDAHLYAEGNGYDCNTVQRQSICFRNLSNTLLDGVLAFTYDSLFQDHVELTTPIDSTMGDTVYMSFEQLIPGQMLVYEIGLWTPTVDHIGAFLHTSLAMYAYDEETLSAVDYDSLVYELTCAYDPNDKQVFPNGYSDAHYVPENDFLEYLVRFQNTGNAPATDVIIRDTLDLGLDISSFELVANSHSVFTTVDPETREVEFYFQDIQLPDSVNNEPESHGLVSYSIRPQSDLPLLTELNNTAYIFFDNNPPIVTNTTWSTTYDCSLFEVSFTDDGAILTASAGDSYQWYHDGEPIEGADSPIFEAFLNGEYSVEISNNFPCSDLTSSIYILLDDIDELTDSPIALFPNPMTTSAILDLGDLRGDFTIEIYDVTGKLLRSEQQTTSSQQLTLQREDLSTGQYLLRLTSEDENYVLPFVVE